VGGESDSAFPKFRAKLEFSIVFTYPAFGCEVVVVVGWWYLFFLSTRVFLLTLGSYLCALAANSLVALWLAPPVAALLSPEDEAPAPATQPQLPLSSYAIIYTRDLFNSVKAPVQADSIAATTSTGVLKLWGTAIRERDRAFAIIEDLSTRTQGLYREGDVIAQGVTLSQVGWDRVLINRNGRLETLTLIPTEVPVPSQLVTSATPVEREDKSGIRQLGQDNFQIDRREVEQAMNSLNELFTQVRAVPYANTEGETQGFRLFSIKPQSLIDRLGLKNGDIVQRVNGIELSDPSTAFGLLQELQGHAQVRVDVLRNHQAVTLSYDIR
jgi:general secretion pathway protein C